jgi:hypothetical protein
MAFGNYITMISIGKFVTSIYSPITEYFSTKFPKHLRKIIEGEEPAFCNILVYVRIQHHF